MTTQSGAPVLLELREVSKTFGGVVALKDVSLEVAAGEVHAVVGENGAGKSTLGKLVVGALTPDSGTITVDGRSHDRLTPDEALRLGIAMVYQELHLVPWMSVEANLFLGRETTHRFGSLDQRAMRQRALEVFGRLGVDLDLDVEVSTLSVAQYQLAEIARAILLNPRLIIMDEPSAVLGGASLERVLAIVRALRDERVGVIYISHRLNEVFEVADRVTVLRDGHLVQTLPTSATSMRELVKLMVGREVAPPAPRAAAKERTKVLEVRELRVRPGAPPNDLDLYAGEVVGVAGMVGSGRSSLARSIAGAHPAATGTIKLMDHRVAIRKPADAIGHGICMVPEDRKSEGLLQTTSIANNIALPWLSWLSTMGVLDSRRERDLAEQQISDVGVRPPKADVRVSALSGGNQQKVVLAKWLARQPRVLILDEPTRGIDVGAKAEIHERIRALADQGMAVLMISSELLEVLSASDRILVMRDGVIVTELDPVGATEESILAYAVARDHDESAPTLGAGAG